MSRSVSNFAIAACAFELSPTGALRVFPAGEFRARDGRPTDVPAWKVTPQSARRLIDKLSARKDDLVIDYEHQTLYTEKNGQPAPAAGWMRPRAELRADGLYMTDVEYTERAKAGIAAKELRYFSPVFSYDKKTGEVLELLMGALTNNAGLDGLTDLTALAAARFDINSNEEHAMDKAQLALLGLAEDATADQITATLTALKTRADGAATEIAALKATQADPAKFVPVALFNEVKAEVAALSVKVVDREKTELIDAAINEGKILGTKEEAYARTLDVVQLKAYIDAQTPHAALRGMQTGGKGPGEESSTGAVTEAACKTEWEGSAALRDEFETAGTYFAFRKVEAASAR